MPGSSRGSESTKAALSTRAAAVRPPSQLAYLQYNTGGRQSLSLGSQRDASGRSGGSDDGQALAMEGSRRPSTETLDVFRISRPDAGRRALGFGGRAAGRCRDVAALDAGRGVMEPGSAATEASAKARAQGQIGRAHV